MAKSFKATRPGQCAVCGDAYKKRTMIVRYGDGYAHRPCAESARQRALITDGYTYAGQKSSGWRMGQGPGSARSRY